jgi:hypothetical protein
VLNRGLQIGLDELVKDLDTVSVEKTRDKYPQGDTAIKSYCS